MSEPRPERGGAWDFPGQVRPEYAPRRDGEPDPGEIVWVWVPYEEDVSQGKDRPVVVVGRAADDHQVLVALMLSSKDHDGDEHWHRIGAGAWDGEQRPSWARVDRPLALTPESVRREGTALDASMFLAVVEHAAGLRDRLPARAHLPSAGGRIVHRLVGVYRANGGPLGEVAYAVGRLVGRAHCGLCDVTHSPVRRKAEWDRMAASLGVPFDLVHLNHTQGELRRLVPDKKVAPAVLAEVDGTLQFVLQAPDIVPLSGSVVAFEQALLRSLRHQRLSLG